MYLSDIKSCIHRGAILIRWGAILIRWGAILIRRGARCSSMLWTLCEVSSFPRVCLCWQLLASVLLASVLLPINLILLCIYLTLNLVFPVLIRRGAIHIRRGAILIRWGTILIRRGARCSSMLWTLCEVSSFPRVCLCWQLLASVLLASVLLSINLILSLSLVS